MTVKTGNMPKGLKRYWQKQNAKNKPKRRNVSMAKRKTTRRKKTTLPLSVVLGFTPLVSRGVALYQQGGLQGLQQITSSIVPYDFVNRRPTMANLGTGLWPIVGGLLVHKIVGGYLGVNRAMGRAGIPFIRL